MNDVMPIVTREIGGEKQFAVDARKLHERLASKQRFTDWIRGRIRQYGFVEGVDYETTISGVSHSATKNPQGGRPTAEYVLTLDMAKELAMVERNETGRKVRRYFIDCEKQLRNRPILPRDAMERLRYFTEAMDGEGVLIQEQELVMLVRQVRELMNELHSFIVEKDQAVDMLIDTVERNIGRKLDQPRVPAIVD